MRETSLAEASIKELKKNVERAKRRKKHLLDYLHHLHISYAHGKISYAQYIETTHKKHNGRNIQELIHYYDHFIRDAEKEIRKHTHKNRSFNIFIITLIFSLILIGSYQYIQPTITGFFTGVENETKILNETNVTIPEVNETLPEENITGIAPISPETPIEPPEITKKEEALNNGKKIETVIPQGLENSPIKAQISESWNIKNSNSLRLQWMEGNQYLQFLTKDNNNNGLIDEISWISPASGNQTFEIIVITKAEHLDSNRNFISDIYDEVKELDGTWSETIPNQDYIRVTFAENLTNQNDITLWPRIVNGAPRIEVYEVDSDTKIAEFTSLNSNEYNTIYLTNLISQSQDTFDLRVIGGSVEIDHIVDPPAKIVDNSFSCDKTSIAVGETTVCTGDYSNSGDSFAVTCTLVIQNEGTTSLSNACGGNNLRVSAINVSGASAAGCSDTGAGTIDCVNWPSTADNQVIIWTIEGCVVSTGNTLDTFTICSSTLNNNALDINVTATNTAPHSYNASTNNTNPLPGANVSHNINWTDDADLDYATLEINATGASCNTAANVTNTAISGTVAWSNLTWAPAEACEGKTIGWKQYANDSSNNWNVTSLQTYVVQNVNPIASFGTNPVDNYNSSSSSVTFDLKVSDNLGVSFLRLYGNWTAAGWHANQTNSTPANDTFWNVTVSGIADGRYVWGAWGNDTLNNQDFTDTNRTLTVDTTAPSLSNANSNTTSLEQNLQFCLNVTATDSLTGINLVYAQLVNTTATANYTMTETGGACSGTSSDGVYGVALTATATGLWNYTKAFANDSLNNKVEFDFTDITINVTAVSNTAPEVVVVANNSITDFSNGPNEGPVLTYSIINFTAYDAEGFTNLNVSSAQIKYTLSGESTRSNSCTNSVNYSTNYANFTCNVTMYWFDGSGLWTINATISDSSNANGKNDTTTFFLGATSAFVASPTALTWGAITAGLTDQLSNNDPVLFNNTGNVNKNIEINSTNLRGEEVSSLALWAGNFSTNTADACNGISMSDHSFVNITSASLLRGNFSINNGTAGQEQLYFCIEQVGSELTAQSYSTANEGLWTIRIVLVALATGNLAKRKKKKKEKKEDNLIESLDLLEYLHIVDKLKKQYKFSEEEVVKTVIEKISKKYNLAREDLLKIMKAREGIAVPISIFSKELGALESLAKYMKENLNMTYKEISQELGRDERTIWTAYKKASQKVPKSLEIKETKINIPIDIFKDEKLTVLEAIILHLKEKGMKYVEIGKLLDRDQRSMRIIHLNAVDKIKRNV